VLCKALLENIHLGGGILLNVTAKVVVDALDCHWIGHLGIRLSSDKATCTDLRIAEVFLSHAQKWYNTK